MVFYTTVQLIAQLIARTRDLLKNVQFSEILEENYVNHLWKYLE